MDVVVCQPTVDLEGVACLEVSRRRLAEDGEHAQEVVERQVAAAVLREHFADAPPEGVLLKLGHAHEDLHGQLPTDRVDD